MTLETQISDVINNNGNNLKKKKMLLSRKFVKSIFFLLTENDLSTFPFNREI